MINVARVSPEEYALAFTSTPHVFNTVEFNRLNSSRCEEVHFLTFTDTRLRAGMILGRTADGYLASPFSAPFGGFTFNRRQHLSTIDEITRGLHDYAAARGLSLRITLPPMWHNPTVLSLCVSSLSRLEGATSYVDVCYHLPLDMESNPLRNATSRARADLRHALDEPFRFTAGGCSPEEIERAYRLIKKNHDTRGYPVRMSLPLMIETSALMHADTFFLTHGNNDEAAAAIVFTTLPGVAQPIIWGDDVDLRQGHSMYRLCHDIAAHYSAAGYRVLDLGPSTERSVPNFGLCSFKEALGLEASLRHTFTIPPR